MPVNVSELRSFLGIVSKLGKFIVHLAEKDKPLWDILSKKTYWVWGVEQARAFQNLNDMLAMYDPNGGGVSSSQRTSLPVAWEDQ